VYVFVHFAAAFGVVLLFYGERYAVFLRQSVYGDPFSDILGSSVDFSTV